MPFGLHQRQELHCDTGAASQKLGWKMFDYNHQDSSIDVGPITGSLTWPSLSAQCLQALPGEASLMRMLAQGERWESAVGCWKAELAGIWVSSVHARL